MNDLENTLRDALGARATAVTTDPAAYDAVLRRRERRRVRRWTTAAVAATAVTAAAFIAVGDSPKRVRPAAPLAPAPALMAAVTDGQIRVYDPAAPSRSGFQPSGYKAVSVSAAGGDRFYSAAVDARDGVCRSVLGQVDVTGPDDDRREVYGDLPGPNPFNGQVTDVAVSPDGRRLAYVVYLAHPSGTCGVRQEVRVRDVDTGAERAWTRDPGAPVSYPTVKAPRWAPDNRHLALGGGFAVLDTAAQETTYRIDARDTVTIDGTICEVSARAYRPPHGTEVVGARCRYDRPEIEGLYEVSPDGRATQRLFLSGGNENRVSAVTFDPSGDHALVLIGDIAGDILFRWDRDTGLRPFGTRKSEVAQAAW